MTKYRVFSRVSAFALLPALSLLAVGRLTAQSTASPSPGPASLKPADEETIELSPFVIEADEDEGYSAKNTLAGTRLRTELKDVGSAISVVTQKFLKDTNSKSSADLLVYTTGTEVAGQGGNFVGGGDGNIINDGAYSNPSPNTRVRGLAAADNLRDFFLTDIPWDSYNVGRVDLQRGPNSILFGIGSPAGVINSSLNTASFRDENKVEVQVATFGSVRGTVDFNKAILKDELAVRVSALLDETNYRQKPAFRDDHRVFGALNYQPKFLAKGSARTSLRANYEKGDINGINPRLTPPMDAITPWFTSMNKATYPWLNSNQVTDRANARYSPYVGAAGGRIYDGQVVTFDANSSTQGVAFSASPYSFPTGQAPEANDPSNGSYKGITTYNNIANNLRLPGYVINPYKAKSLTDSSIFNFYDNLIEGENRLNTSEFDAYNVTLNQTFMNNKIGFEVAYDKQDAEWDFRNFLAWDAAAITVDIMSTFIDGSANPNVGRPMVIGGGGSAGSGRVNRVRESTRATAFGEVDFRDVFERDSKAAKILGRHIFTYSGAIQRNDTLQTSWNNWFVGPGFLQSANAAVGQAGRDAATLTYLGPSLASRTTASGLGLGRITAQQAATSTTVRNWDTLTRTYKTYALPIVNPNDPSFNDSNRPYTQASKTRDDIASQVFVWQGYLFDGAIVPMVGWRKDVAESFNAGSPDKVGGLVTNFADPEWRIPTGLIENGTGKNKERIYNNVDGQTHTFSIVGHAPKAIMERLPGNMAVSVFYNRSANFQPDASRKDIVGGIIPSPTGKTKDYGIAISALNGKIALKVNRYETSVTNATLSGELGNAYLIGAGEAWGQAAAYQLRANNNVWPGDGNYGTTTAGSKYGAGHTLRWQPANAGNLVADSAGRAPGSDGYQQTYSQASINAQYDIQRASTDDWLSKPVPASFQLAWGMTGYATGSGNWSMNSVAVTGDTLSRGTEIEIVASPIDGLDISINASKTEAKRLKIGQAYSDWIEQRYKDYQGPMGEMRLWGNGNWALDKGAGGTVRDKFENETLPAYKLALALNNSNVSELRPWRFNMTANYGFKKGRLKDANIGGSYRWQDKQVTGYRLNSAGDGYIVDNPFFGPSDDAFDLWIGYQTKIFSDRVKWRVQLNVRDVFASDKLIPVTVQPDGSPGAYRIPEPRVISLTNSFTF